jgi:Na+-translocating ferredoxin:NAD+ oxidoreductase RnfD subunit
MASVTIRFSILLMLLGGLFLYLTKAGHALIPAGFGVVLLVLGLLARTDDSKRRMLVMHIAVTIALLGFLFPAAIAGKALWAAHNGGNVMILAIREQLLMAIICLVYVWLCVRSFIAARKARLA